MSNHMARVWIYLSFSNRIHSHRENNSAHDKELVSRPCLQGIMKKILFFIPTIMYYALIFFLSSRSYDIKIDVLFLDKVIHLVEFTVLGLFLSFGFFMTLRSSLMIKAVFTLSSGILLGVLDEFHQYFIPNRSIEFSDVVADAFGILVGLFLYFYFSRTVKGKTFAQKLSKL